MIQPENALIVDRLRVRIFETRERMGAGAAADAARKIRKLLEVRPYVNMIFAAAPSQNEFLAELAGQQDIDWQRINAFHMDEYLGLGPEDPESFGYFLNQRIFEVVPFHEVHLLNGKTADAAAECRRYSELLDSYPVDIVCMGIGENGHVAFNDPHVADFHDPDVVKVVDLDEVSRLQQVHDGCFDSLEKVPVSALTLTVPTLLKASALFCIVPGPNKATAVYHTLNSEIKEHYPATALREHPEAILYLDKTSAGKL